MPDLQATIQVVVNFLYAVIVALVPVLIAYYAPIIKSWIAAKNAEVEVQLNQEEMWLIKAVVKLAVQAVEQLKKSGAIVDNRHAFDTAQATAESWLKARGILVDMTLLRAAIESAVRELPRPGPDERMVPRSSPDERMVGQLNRLP